MHSIEKIVMNAILIGVAFLMLCIGVERNILFVSSATVAQQSSADTKPTTPNDYVPNLSSTTDRYPKLYAENDNYGKQQNKHSSIRTKQKKMKTKFDLPLITTYNILDIQ